MIFDTSFFWRQWNWEERPEIPLHGVILATLILSTAIVYMFFLYYQALQRELWWIGFCLAVTLIYSSVAIREMLFFWHAYWKAIKALGARGSSS